MHGTTALRHAAAGLVLATDPQTGLTRVMPGTTSDSSRSGPAICQGITRRDSDRHRQRIDRQHTRPEPACRPSRLGELDAHQQRRHRPVPGGGRATRLHQPRWWTACGRPVPHRGGACCDRPSAGPLGACSPGIRAHRGVPGTACRDRPAHLCGHRRHLWVGERAADDGRDAGTGPAGQGAHRSGRPHRGPVPDLSRRPRRLASPDAPLRASGLGPRPAQPRHQPAGRQVRVCRAQLL